MKIISYARRNCRQDCVLLFIMLWVTLQSNGQDSTKTVPDGTEGERLDTRNTIPKHKKWNEFNLGFTKLKVGAAFL